MVEILPLVEFVIEDGVSDIEAVRLIDTPVDKSTKTEGWKQEVSDTHQMLRLDDESEEDPFGGKLLNYEVCLILALIFFNGNFDRVGMATLFQ